MKWYKRLFGVPKTESTEAPTPTEKKLRYIKDESAPGTITW